MRRLMGEKIFVVLSEKESPRGINLDNVCWYCPDGSDNLEVHFIGGSQINPPLSGDQITKFLDAIEKFRV
jgi:hypothetical protein